MLLPDSNGPNLAGVVGGKLYPLFDPRKQNWKRHFRWENTTLIGRTFSGKVTVQVLNINESSRLMLRENLLFEGRFPLDEYERFSRRTAVKTKHAPFGENKST